MKTIAAISTGVTTSGISIIRISGPGAFEIGDRIFQNKSKKDILKRARTHTIHHGFIYDGEDLVDEVLVSVFHAPHTYTGEDTVEINCHGGVFVTRKILETVLKNGATLAAPGEFSKRAFLNGRMDLSRAESVIDVIHAENEYALRAGLRGLKGEVSEKIKALRSRLVDEMAFIEAAIDDPEHYDLSAHRADLSESMEMVENELEEIIRCSKNGEKILHGIRTVLLGIPNAGKSSVLNYLAGFEKAIVTDIPGTTRDVLEIPVSFDGLDFILEDTAGLRDTKDQVEQIGVKKAKEEAQDADLVLYVVDGLLGLSSEDMENLEEMDPKKILLLWNKSDREQQEIPEDVKKRFQVITFSSVSGEGKETLISEMVQKFSGERFDAGSELLVSSERIKELLGKSLESISQVINGISQEMSEEFLTIDMMDAYAFLGEIIGEEVTDDVVDRVFEKFCMGK